MYGISINFPLQITRSKHAFPFVYEINNFTPARNLSLLY